MSPHIWLRVVLECLGNLRIVCPVFLSQAHENPGKSAVEKKAGVCSQPWSSGVPFRFFYGLDERLSAPPLLFYPPKHAMRQTEEIKPSADINCEMCGKQRPVYCCTDLVSVRKTGAEGHGVRTA